MDHTLDRPNLAHPTAAPQVCKVGLERPFLWLRRGAHDVARLPGPSLALGVLVAVAGLLLSTVTWAAPYVAPALLGGFLLVGPFIALMLHALSRQLEQQVPADLRTAWSGLRGNAGSIALFGLMLVLAYLLWERTAAIVFAFQYGGEAIRLSALLPDVLLSGQYGALVLSFVGLGALLAAAVFALSVVSAPMLVDRPVDVVTAVLTSLRCCARNPGPMLLWAALIAGLTLLGFATLMLGLALVFPWLAHASWHAYRDLVEVEG